MVAHLGHYGSQFLFLEDNFSILSEIPPARSRYIESLHSLIFGFENSNGFANVASYLVERYNGLNRICLELTVK
jgi:hypothetical protein